MEIIIDTSILCQDFNISGKAFSRLLEGLKAIPARLHVPEVVIDETVNKFCEVLAEAQKELQAANDKISRLGVNVHAQAYPNIKAQGEVYRAELTDRLDKIGAKLVPYPTISHKKVVERDLARMRPFKAKGTGYRDFLIWQNVCALTDTEVDLVVFLTSNSHDFCTNKAIHADLISDVARKDSLEIYTSIQEFVETYVQEKLTLLSKLETQILEEAGLSFSVSDWINENFICEINNSGDLVTLFTALPEGAGKVTLTKISRIKDISVDEARALSKAKSIVTVSISAEIVFSHTLSWSDYLRFVEIQEKLGPTSPFNYISTDETAIVSATFSSVFDSEKGAIASSELDSITGPFDQRNLKGYKSANSELRAEASFEVLDALITAVDNKDHYTRKHSEDVTEYALWIAAELGLPEETMRTLRIGGLLHDVGKIGVPDEILRKPGRLTPEEFENMKRHPRLGELIVGGIPGMESILDVVRSHHERWDGKGYPDQLSGEQIPFMGRLLAVADAFSAMTTDRPYRKGLAFDAALEEIRANIGTQFDPIMAEAFLSAFEKHTTN